MHGLTPDLAAIDLPETRRPPMPSACPGWLSRAKLFRPTSQLDRLQSTAESAPRRPHPGYWGSAPPNRTAPSAACFPPAGYARSGHPSRIDGERMAYRVVSTLPDGLSSQAAGAGRGLISCPKNPLHE